MANSHSLLDHIQVASPCTASWDAMAGDERVRFCAECRKSVYNLSALSRTEAESLVRKHEGQMCVRFFRRDDGTMLTDDCPRGLARVRRAARRAGYILLARSLALASLLAGVILLAWGFRGRLQGGTQQHTFLDTLRALLMPGATTSVMGTPAVVGKMAPPVAVPPIAVVGEMCLPVPSDPEATLPDYVIDGPRISLPVIPSEK